MGEISKLKEIGQKVSAKRAEMGLTQEEFADKYGYARTTLAKLEAGLRDFKSTEILRLAEQLKVSTDYLLGRQITPSTDENVQKLVDRFGLPDEALRGLEWLNASDDEERANARAMLISLLSASASWRRPGEPALHDMLVAMFNFCYRDYKVDEYGKLDVMIDGKVVHALTPGDLRNLDIMRLNDDVSAHRAKVTREGSNGKAQKKR